MAKWSKYKGTPTPKALAKSQEDDRKHGARVYDAPNAVMLRLRLLRERPAPPDQPFDPYEGFDADAIASAKRWYQLAVKSVEVSDAAAYKQWRPYVRLEQRQYGED